MPKIECNWYPMPDLEGDWENDIQPEGCLLTKEEFLEGVAFYCYTDYDGIGQAAIQDRVSDVYFLPSQIKEFMEDKRFTHIFWINK